MKAIPGFGPKLAIIRSKVAVWKRMEDFQDVEAQQALDPEIRVLRGEVIFLEGIVTRQEEQIRKLRKTLRSRR